VRVDSIFHTFEIGVLRYTHGEAEENNKNLSQGASTQAGIRASYFQNTSNLFARPERSLNVCTNSRKKLTHVHKKKNWCPQGCFFLYKLKVTQIDKKFPVHAEIEVSLSRSQKPAIGLNRESVESSVHPHISLP